MVAASGMSRVALPVAVLVALVAGAMTVTHLARARPEKGPAEGQGATAPTAPGSGGERVQPGGTGGTAPPGTQGTSTAQAGAAPAPGDIPPRVPMADLFGDDIVLFASCPSTGGMIEHVAATPLARIFRDPEVQAFLKDLGQRNPGSKKGVDEALPAGEMLKTVFRGPVAFAVLEVDPRREVPDAVLAGELAEGDNSVELLIKLLRPDFEKSGGFSPVSYNGVQYEAFTETGKGVTLAYARMPRYLAVGTSEKALRAFIDRATGVEKKKALDTSERFTSMIRRVGAGADLVAWLDWRRAMELSAPGLTPEERDRLAKSGLDGIDSIGLSCRATPSGVIDRVVVSANRAGRRGLLTVLSPGSGRPSAQTVMPSGTVAMLSYVTEPKRLWDAVRGLADSGFGDADALAGFEKWFEDKARLRFREDVLDCLKGEVTVAAALSPMAMQPNFIAAAEVRDAAAAERVAGSIMDAIAAKAGVKKDRLSIQGVEVSFLSGTGNLLLPSPCCAVKGTRLIAASSTAAMREVLAAGTSGSTLSASEPWKGFERILPASRPGVLFVDVPRLAAMGYETVQSGLIGMRGGRFDFDVNRLPTAAMLMKYLAPGGLTVASDDETISLEASTPAGLVASIAAAVYGFDPVMREIRGGRPGGRTGARAPSKAGTGGDRDGF